MIPILISRRQQESPVVSSARGAASSAARFAQLSYFDFWARPGLLSEPELHLNAATRWLVRAHDMSPDDGVSYGYSLRGGWRPSYIETTGYILKTFFSLSKARNAPQLRGRAIAMADWLLAVQLSNGAFANPRYGNSGIVFDTGQDLLGLICAYEETGAARFLIAAQRAGNWLVEVADDAGHWTRHDYLGVPHAYNTRTAWALLKLDTLGRNAGREEIARANLDWALSRQQRSGLFDDCSFAPGTSPFTHTIAYTIRGFWEAGELLKDQRYSNAALRASNAIITVMEENGSLSGQIDVSGHPRARYCCLTGNCQLSISWAKMFRQTGDQHFRDAALSALRYVMRTQDIYSSDLNVRGAIKGSYPIWGRYAPFTFPSWATKFFIDATLECEPWL